MTLSTAEMELDSASSAAKEAVWLALGNAGEVGSPDSGLLAAGGSKTRGDGGIVGCLAIRLCALVRVRVLLGPWGGTWLQTQPRGNFAVCLTVGF